LLFPQLTLPFPVSSLCLGGDDLARIAHAVNELPGYDIFSIATLAEDAPPGLFSVTRFYVSLKYCLKPVRGSGPSDDAEKILRLAYLIAGGEAAYRDHPFITHHYCPVVSPLTMDVDSTENLIYFTERHLPGYSSIVPNAGLTSPMTLIGEVLAQARRTNLPRTPTAFGRTFSHTGIVIYGSSDFLVGNLMPFPSF